MFLRFQGLSSEQRVRLKSISEFWNEFDPDDWAESTRREALLQLQQKVTDCLYPESPSIHDAERLTALAMLIMTCWDEQ